MNHPAQVMELPGTVSTSTPPRDLALAPANSQRAKRLATLGLSLEQRCGPRSSTPAHGKRAAAAATVTAWVQAKQYQNLATAYGVTAQELAAVASEVEVMTDEAWPSSSVNRKKPSRASTRFGAPPVGSGSGRHTAAAQSVE